MTPRARWALVAVIMLVAVAVAVLPLVWAGGGGRSAEPPPEPGLDKARAAAGLRPCAGGDGPGPGDLRGVTAECLGDGGRVDVGAVLGGRPVLVNVWATWCQPCREELPLLDRYAATEGAIDVVSVVVQSNPGDALGLLADVGARLPTVYDRDGAVGRALRLPTGLPASYVVAADGTVTFITRPRIFRTEDDVRGAVENHLGGTG